MDRTSSPPWQLGETFYGISSGNTPASADYHWLPGKEYGFVDTVHGTGKEIVVRVLRNQSGIALLPGYCLNFKTSAAGDQGFETEVDGYASTLAQRTIICDDQLPAAGVPNLDLFYGVVKGPVLCKSGLAGDITNSIAVGDYLHAQTAAASTFSTTAGRIGEADFNSATTALAGKILAVVGRALSALTTGQTNTSLLVSVGAPYGFGG
jgi:hypothetical protein